MKKVKAAKPKALFKRTESLEPIVTRVDLRKSKFYDSNIIRSYCKFQSGIFGPPNIKLTGQDVICRNLHNFHVWSQDPFDFNRRITALRWHPKKPNLIAVGTKSGELVFRKWVNFGEKLVELSSMDGLGPGNAVTNISFDPFQDNSVFLSSIDGTVKRWDYDKCSGVNLIDTLDGYSNWFCSVSASEDTGLVVVGDTKGTLTIFDKSMKQVESLKIHSKKLTSAEFSDTRSYLLVTASLDQTVKVWDIRNMGKSKDNKGRVKNHVELLEHKTPVNSAYFSKTDCYRLLTTDQKNELRVYRGPNFNLETVIFHPHRQFQHLTAIKATWHPLTDLIVVGRYPDPSWPHYEKELRSIDIIDPSTGAIKVQMVDPILKGISSLNEINPTGDIMASGMGQHLLYWRLRHAKDTTKKADNSDDDEDDPPPPPPKKRKPPSSKTTKKQKKQ